MVADGQSQVTATVTATDASGGVQGDSVTVTTSGATVSQQTCTQTTDASGTCTVSFTVSTNLGQTTVDAADSTSSVNAQSQSFNQVPGSVAHVVLQPISAITADGVSTTTATAAVSDNYGHALSGENVVFGDLGYVNLTPANTASPLDSMGTLDPQLGGATPDANDTITAGLSDTAHSDIVFGGQGNDTITAGRPKSSIKRPRARARRSSGS